MVAAPLVAVEAVTGVGVHLEVVGHTGFLESGLNSGYVIRRGVLVLSAEIAHNRDFNLAGQVNRGRAVAKGYQDTATVIHYGGAEAGTTGRRQVSDTPANAVAHNANFLPPGARIGVLQVADSGVDVFNYLIVPKCAHVAIAGRG